MIRDSYYQLRARLIYNLRKWLGYYELAKKYSEAVELQNRSIQEQVRLIGLVYQAKSLLMEWERDAIFTARRALQLNEADRFTPTADSTLGKTRAFLLQLHSHKDTTNGNHQQSKFR